MKKLILGWWAALFFLLPSANAQSSCSGVYLSADDLSAGKLMGNVATRRSDNSLMGKYLFVQVDDRIRRLERKDIYAVQYCDGRVFRVFDGGYYTLLNPGEPIPLYVVKEYPAGKGDILRTKYYFSKDAASDIEDLTLTNVKEAFAGNAKFEEQLDLQFRTDRDLYAYDDYNKCYRLDRLYVLCK